MGPIPMLSCTYGEAHQNPNTALQQRAPDKGQFPTSMIKDTTRATFLYSARRISSHPFKDPTHEDRFRNIETHLYRMTPREGPAHQHPPAGGGAVPRPAAIVPTREAWQSLLPPDTALLEVDEASALRATLALKAKSTDLPSGRDKHQVNFLLTMTYRYPDIPAQTQQVLIHRINTINIVLTKGWSTDIVAAGGDTIFGIHRRGGQRWRDMRNALTPTFTSSKMRSMFILLNQVGQQMAEYLQDLHKIHGKDVHTVEMKDFFTRFASDVIATAAFGIQVNSMKDPTNEFYKAGKQLANFEGLQKLIFLGYLFCSKLMTMFRIPFLARGPSDFFRNLVKTNIRTREKEGIIRPDMIHLLMQARKGELTKDTQQDEDQGNMSTGKAGKLDLTDEDIVAQAMVFFLAGFDTASTLLCYTAHLLAVNEDSQVQLQSEIDDMLRETEENISYEAIQAMKYLDMVISESLRIFPPVDNVDRVCVKPYSIPVKGNQPGTTFQLDDIALIPILGLHRDPEFFPEPDRFDPERFSEENKSSIKPFTYMPFGIGQRSCIGNRFALMEAKVALVYLLSKFSLRVVDKTAVKIEFSANNLTPTPKGGFWLGIQFRDRKE
uniref:Cytochrome P450 n=1 Tax=Timema cristinae TaxID=61476 RepID=A0A7R9CNP9_TIMCR|nr:unnamed protein product [Timema cristinae]